MLLIVAPILWRHSNLDPAKMMLSLDEIKRIAAKGSLSQLKSLRIRVTVKPAAERTAIALHNFLERHVETIKLATLPHVTVDTKDMGKGKPKPPPGSIRLQFSRPVGSKPDASGAIVFKSAQWDLVLFDNCTSPTVREFLEANKTVTDLDFWGNQPGNGIRVPEFDTAVFRAIMRRVHMPFLESLRRLRLVALKLDGTFGLTVEDPDSMGLTTLTIQNFLNVEPFLTHSNMFRKVERFILEDYAEGKVFTVQGMIRVLQGFRVKSDTAARRLDQVRYSCVLPRLYGEGREEELGIWR